MDAGAEVERDPAPRTEPPDRSAMRAVTRQALSVGIATSAYAISFGAVSVAAGLTVWQTVVMSALLFTGGSQFALVGVLGAGGSGVAAVATSTLLGVRNGLYALQVSRILQVRGLRRLLAAQLTIDESTAVAIGQTDPRAMRRGFWLTGVIVYAGWNLSTLAGALLGNAIGDPKVYGFDAAAAAAFCALLWPRLRSLEAGATAALAALLTVVLVPLAPAGVPVLVAALAAVVVGLLGRGRRDSEPADGRGRRGRRREGGMNAWVTVLVACALAYLLKLAGYLVPAHWLSGPRISRVTALLPVALLTGLVVVQAFATPDHGLTLDARAAGLGVAVVALLLRAPFIVVVVLAAGTAALLRHFGWG